MGAQTDRQRALGDDRGRRSVSTQLRSVAPKTYDLLIDGEWLPSRSHETYARIDPFDGSITAHYAQADESDVEAAIRSARRAFDEGPWRRKTAKERAAVLRRVAEMLVAESEHLQGILMRELGQPRQAGNVAHAAESLLDVASIAETWREESITLQRSDAVGIIAHEPIGVVGALLAWNRPLSFCHKAGPALAAGCSVVLKPAHFTAGAVIELARMFMEAGLPPGVLNVVTSDTLNGSVAGQAIASSQLVDMITFTGSTATGTKVMQAAASNLKRLTLELGGKSPNVVFADASPIEDAVEGAYQGIAPLTGQACIAGSRLLVQRSIKDEFVAKLIERFKDVQMGDPLDETTTMGPLVSDTQLERVTRYVGIGRDEGRLVLGGDRPADARLQSGSFFEPTIFDEVDPRATIAQEEIFGPVLAIVGFDTVDEAIRISNSAPYGLASAVWTSNVNTAMKFARGVRAGTVWINSFRESGIFGMPAGGYGISGLGREYGPEGYESFLEKKAIHLPFA